MSKLKELINNHKSFAVIGILALILLIIMMVIFVNLLVGGNKDKYGDRLEGIENVKITSNFLNDLEDKIKNTEKVNEVTSRVQGKIVRIVITFNQNVSLADAKVVAESTIIEFSEEELAFYDIEYLLTRVIDSENEEDIAYNVTGTKHPLIENISWTKS